MSEDIEQADSIFRAVFARARARESRKRPDVLRPAGTDHALERTSHGILSESKIAVKAHRAARHFIRALTAPPASSFLAALPRHGTPARGKLHLVSRWAIWYKDPRRADEDR